MPSSTSVCTCCGQPFEYTFDVPSWRSPNWATFAYGECGTCGSLTLLDRADPAQYYADYFSFKPRLTNSSRKRRVLGAAANRVLLREGPLGRTTGRVVRRPYWLRWFAGSGIRLDAQIVEIGSGSGALLLDLNRHGFSNLLGIDPFVAEDIEYSLQVRVVRADVEAAPSGTAAFILKHSLEHIDDPIGQLSTLRRLLKPNGIVVIEVPVAQGPVWSEYRDNWIALDAPVHRFTPTQAGIESIAARSGYRVERRFGESVPYHYSGSELISRRCSPLTHAADDVLSPLEIAHLARKTRRISRADECPQMTFILRPVGQ